MNGMLYGTTMAGGSDNWGVVYSVDPSTGSETVLHSFCRPQTGQTCEDGYIPNGILINVKGLLYGTTYYGGAYAEGTIFSIDAQTGKEKIVYSFGLGGAAGAAYPSGGLIYKQGKLYGTTWGGGLAGWGAAFVYDFSTGSMTTLYSFCSVDPSCPDGANPGPGVVDVQGILYGVTNVGGHSGCGQFGCGIAYSVNAAHSTEKVLYKFCPGGENKNCRKDGGTPTDLISVNGTLFGTAAEGGHGFGGVIFSLDPATGVETIVHGFCPHYTCTDGETPTSLISADGILYGTAAAGGDQGNGTVFAVNPDTGKATVLHSFCAATDCADGAGPNAVIVVKRLLYGASYIGGTGSQCPEYHGCGAIFSIKP